MEIAGFVQVLLASFLVALMVDSVKIDTKEMNTFLLTHVDDEGQSLSSDVVYLPTLTFGLLL